MTDQERRLVDKQPWYVSEFGTAPYVTTFDVRAMVQRPEEPTREIVIIKNIPRDAAELIVAEHTTSLLWQAEARSK